MAVLIEMQSIVVRRAAIDAKVAGGWNRFLQAVPNGSFCADEHLASVGLMASGDVVRFLAHLQALGLEAARDNVAMDAVVVDQFHGPALPAPWLQCAPRRWTGSDVDVLTASLVGAAPSELGVPDGWSLERSSYAPGHRAGSSPDGADLKFLRHESGVDVFWHTALGQEVFVGRSYDGPGAAADVSQPATASPATQAVRASWERLLDKAGHWRDRSGAVATVPPLTLGWLAAIQARRAISFYEKALAIVPTDDRALLWKGKCEQAIGQAPQALDSYTRGFLANPSNADLAREASITATELRRFDVAANFAREALRLQPDGEGLQTNLALACLFGGDDVSALRAAEEAKRQEPDHPGTLAVFLLVREVTAGRMVRPGGMLEIDWETLQRVA